MTFHCSAPVRHSSLLSRKSFGLLFLAALLGIALSGCGGNSTATTTSQVRTFNAYVPAAGTVGSITAATTTGTTLTGIGILLNFGQFSGGGTYALINSGTSTIVASGTGLTTPLSLTSTFAANNTTYTLVATGQAGQTGAFLPQLIAIPNFTANQIPIPAGDAAVRVVDLSLNTNPIGLYNTVSGVPSAVVASSLLSVAYGYGPANAYVAIPTAQLNSFGIVDTANPSTVLSLSTSSNLNTFAFTTGQAYTLYVYGQQGNAAEPFSAVWVEDFP